MLDNYNIKDWYSMSNGAIIKELGSFIKQTRLKKNYTQNFLSSKAGVHRVTVSEFEQGLRGSLTTFIQLLRALNELEVLAAFKISNTISPLQMAKLEAKKRKRASREPKKKIILHKKKVSLSKSKHRK